jgi:hypothetical protein
MIMAQDSTHTYNSQIHKVKGKTVPQHTYGGRGGEDV